MLFSSFIPILKANMKTIWILLTCLAFACPIDARPKPHSLILSQQRQPWWEKTFLSGTGDEESPSASAPAKIVRTKSIFAAPKLVTYYRVCQEGYHMDFAGRCIKKHVLFRQFNKERLETFSALDFLEYDSNNVEIEADDGDDSNAVEEIVRVLGPRTRTGFGSRKTASSTTALPSIRESTATESATTTTGSSGTTTESATTTTTKSQTTTPELTVSENVQKIISLLKPRSDVPTKFSFKSWWAQYF